MPFGIMIVKIVLVAASKATWWLLASVGPTLVTNLPSPEMTVIAGPRK